MQENNTTQESPNEVQENDQAIAHKNLKSVFILFLLIGLIGVIGFLYLQNQQQKELISRLENTAQKTNDAPTHNNITSDGIVEIDVKDNEPTKEGIENRLKNVPFDDYLLENCNANLTIDLTKLPVSLSSSLLSKYGLTNAIKCVPGASNNGSPKPVGTHKYSDGYVKAENRVTNESLNVPLASLIVGDMSSDDSSFEVGKFVVFDDLDPMMTVDGVDITVTIKEPGPYGLHSYGGVWLEVNGFRKVGDYKVVSESFRVIEAEGDILDLFKQYGVEHGDEIFDSLQYSANERSEEFKNAFISKYIADYPNIQPPYKEMIDSVINDANSVSPM